MHLQLNPQPTLPQANPNFTSTPRIPSTHPNHTTQQLPPNSPPSIPKSASQESLLSPSTTTQILFSLTSSSRLWQRNMKLRRPDDDNDDGDDDEKVKTAKITREIEREMERYDIDFDISQKKKKKKRTNTHSRNVSDYQVTSPPFPSYHGWMTQPKQSLRFVQLTH